MRMVSAIVLAAGLAMPVMALDDDAVKKAQEAAKQVDEAAKAAEAKVKADAEAAAAAAKFAQDEAQKAGEEAMAAMKKKAVPVPDNAPVSTNTLPSGVVIDELKIGEGMEVPEGASVVAFYHGTLKSDPSKVFDSAFDRGEPIGFPLSNVIRGWQEGVPGMKIGGVRKLTIPAALAYGAQSPSPDIPANSDLVFVIQMVDFVRFTDTTVGTGEAVDGNAVVVPVTNYVIKDESGKVVDQNAAGAPYVWVPGEFDALFKGLDGMKVGGKRTVHIPKDFNGEVPGLETKRPLNQTISVEVELVAVRNLRR
jgi:FKBP-type peptidyl-prolyl cis-trans isomerase